MEETWRIIPGTNDLYSASSLGRIRKEEHKVYYGDHRSFRVEKMKIKKECLHSNKKYKFTVITVDGKTRKIGVHRLIAWAFIGAQQPGIEVRHINGNSLDNRLENITYGTKSDNMRDAIEHRTFSMSDWHPCAKLTKEQVSYIRTSSKEYKELAKELNVHPHTIHKIRRKEIRNHDE